MNSWNVKLSGFFETREQSFISTFSICMTVPLNVFLVTKQYGV